MTGGRAALVLIGLVGCHDAGTITIDLGLDSGAVCGTTTHVVLIAEPTSCDACVCASCIGKLGARTVCSLAAPCTPEMVSGAALSLDPGHWAVVAELVDADDHAFAFQCIDVDVDADGTADKDLSGPGFTCTATCE